MKNLLTTNRIDIKASSFAAKYLIWLLLALAFLIRFTGLDFGLPYLYSPDEHLFVEPALQMLTTPTLNPGWYGAGTLIIYLLAVLWLLLTPFYLFYCFLTGTSQSLAGLEQIVKEIPQSDPTLIYFSGRILMVFFAVVTIYIVYLTAKKLFNKPVALLAVLCLAVSPLHVGHSRLIRPDIATTMMVMFSMFFLLKFAYQSQKSIWLILASLFAGFSIAAKYTSGVIVFPILLYSLICDLKILWQKNKKQLMSNSSEGMNFPLTKYLIDSIKFKTCLSKALIFVFLGYFIFAPFTLIEFDKLHKALVYESRKTHLGHERLPGIQNHLWYIKNTFRYGIGGLFFEIFAGIGLLLTILKKRNKARLLFIIFPILMFLIIGCAKLRWSRWLMPVIPFEAIFFGCGFYYIYEYLRDKKVFRNYRALLIAMFVLIAAGAFVPPTVRVIKEAVKLTSTDTRTLSKNWVENNLPAHSRIVYEHYAPHLHIRPKQKFQLFYTNWGRIASRPLAFYKTRKIDYLVITSSFKDRIYKEPLKYPAEISRYEQLKREAGIVKVFDNKDRPGPIIEIYKLTR